MRVRKNDADGDMVFGRANSYYVNDPAGVAQCAMTRLALWQGTWFIDKTAGTPWLQQILGKKLAADAVVRARILGTPGLSEISAFESTQDPDSRSLNISAEIVTQYGDSEISWRI